MTEMDIEHAPTLAAGGDVDPHSAVPRRQPTVLGVAWHEIIARNAPKRSPTSARDEKFLMENLALNGTQYRAFCNTYAQSDEALKLDIDFPKTELANDYAILRNNVTGFLNKHKNSIIDVQFLALYGIMPYQSMDELPERLRNFNDFVNVNWLVLMRITRNKIETTWCTRGYVAYALMGYSFEGALIGQYQDYYTNMVWDKQEPEFRKKVKAMGPKDVPTEMARGFVEFMFQNTILEQEIIIDSFMEMEFVDEEGLEPLLLRMAAWWFQTIFPLLNRSGVDLREVLEENQSFVPTLHDYWQQWVINKELNVREYGVVQGTLAQCVKADTPVEEVKKHVQHDLPMSIERASMYVQAQRAARVRANPYGSEMLNVSTRIEEVAKKHETEVMPDLDVPGSHLQAVEATTLIKYVPRGEATMVDSLPLTSDVIREKKDVEVKAFELDMPVASYQQLQNEVKIPGAEDNVIVSGNRAEQLVLYGVPRRDGPSGLADFRHVDGLMNQNVHEMLVIAAKSTTDVGVRTVISKVQQQFVIERSWATSHIEWLYHEYDRNQAQLVARNQMSLQDMEASARTEIQAQFSAYKREIAQLKAEAAEQISGLESEGIIGNRQQVAQLKQALQFQEQLQRELQDVQARLQQKDEERLALKREKDAEIARLKQEHQQEEARLKQEHEVGLKKLRGASGTGTTSAVQDALLQAANDRAEQSKQDALRLVNELSVTQAQLKAAQETAVSAKATAEAQERQKKLAADQLGKTIEQLRAELEQKAEELQQARSAPARRKSQAMGGNDGNDPSGSGKKFTDDDMRREKQTIEELEASVRDITTNLERANAAKKASDEKLAAERKKLVAEKAKLETEQERARVLESELTALQSVADRHKSTAEEKERLRKRAADELAETKRKLDETKEEARRHEEAKNDVEVRENVAREKIAKLETKLKAANEKVSRGATTAADTTEIDTLKEALAAAKQEYQELDSKFQNEKTAKSKAVGEATTLRREVEKKERALEELQEELQSAAGVAPMDEELPKQIKQLEKDLRAAKRAADTAAQLEKDVEERDARIEELEAELAAAEAGSGTTDTKSRDEIKRLKKELEEAKKAKSEVVDPPVAPGTPVPVGEPLTHEAFEELRRRAERAHAKAEKVHESKAKAAKKAKKKLAKAQEAIRLKQAELDQVVRDMPRKEDCDDELAKLQRKLTAAEVESARLGKLADEAERKATKLEGKLSKRDEDVRKAELEVAKLRLALKDAEDRLARAQADLDGADKGDLDALRKQLAEAEARAVKAAERLERKEAEFKEKLGASKDKAQAEVAKKDARIAELKEKLAKCKEGDHDHHVDEGAIREAAELQAKLKTEESERKALEKKVKGLERKLEKGQGDKGHGDPDLKAKLQKEKDERKALEKKVKDLEKDVNGKGLGDPELRAKLQKEKEDRKALEKEVKAMKKDMDNKGGDPELKAKLQKEKEDRKALEKKVKALEKDMQHKGLGDPELKAKLKDEAKERKALEKQVKALEKKVAEKPSADKKDGAASKECADEDLRVEVARLEEAAKQTENWHKVATEQNATIVALRKEICDLNMEIQKLEDESTGIGLTEAAFAKLREAKENEMTALREKLQDKLDQALKEKADLQVDLRMMELELDAAQNGDDHDSGLAGFAVDKNGKAHSKHKKHTKGAGLAIQVMREVIEQVRDALDENTDAIKKQRGTIKALISHGNVASDELTKNLRTAQGNTIQLVNTVRDENKKDAAKIVDFLAKLTGMPGGMGAMGAGGAMGRPGDRSQSGWNIAHSDVEDDPALFARFQKYTLEGKQARSGKFKYISCSGCSNFVALVEQALLADGGVRVVACQAHDFELRNKIGKFEELRCVFPDSLATYISFREDPDQRRYRRAHPPGPSTVCLNAAGEDEEGGVAPASPRLTYPTSPRSPHARRESDSEDDSEPEGDDYGIRVTGEEEKWATPRAAMRESTTTHARTETSPSAPVVEHPLRTSRGESATAPRSVDTVPVVEAAPRAPVDPAPVPVAAPAPPIILVSQAMLDDAEREVSIFDFLYKYAAELRMDMDVSKQISRLVPSFLRASSSEEKMRQYEALEGIIKVFHSSREPDAMSDNDLSEAELDEEDMLRRRILVKKEDVDFDCYEEWLHVLFHIMVVQFHFDRGFRKSARLGLFRMFLEIDARNEYFSKLRIMFAEVRDRVMVGKVSQSMLRVYHEAEKKLYEIQEVMGEPIAEKKCSGWVLDVVFDDAVGVLENMNDSIWALPEQDRKEVKEETKVEKVEKKAKTVKLSTPIAKAILVDKNERKEKAKEKREAHPSGMDLLPPLRGHTLEEKEELDGLMASAGMVDKKAEAIVQAALTVQEETQGEMDALRSAMESLQETWVKSMSRSHAFVEDVKAESESYWDHARRVEVSRVEQGRVETYTQYIEMVGEMMKTLTPQTLGAYQTRLKRYGRQLKMVMESANQMMVEVNLKWTKQHIESEEYVRNLLLTFADGVPEPDLAVFRGGVPLGVTRAREVVDHCAKQIRTFIHVFGGLLKDHKALVVSEDERAKVELDVGMYKDMLTEYTNTLQSETEKAGVAKESRSAFQKLFGPLDQCRKEIKAMRAKLQREHDEFKAQVKEDEKDSFAQDMMAMISSYRARLKGANKAMNDFGAGLLDEMTADEIASHADEALQLETRYRELVEEHSRSRKAVEDRWVANEHLEVVAECVQMTRVEVEEKAEDPVSVVDVPRETAIFNVMRGVMLESPQLWLGPGNADLLRLYQTYAAAVRDATPPASRGVILLEDAPAASSSAVVPVVHTARRHSHPAPTVPHPRIIRGPSTRSWFMERAPVPAPIVPFVRPRTASIRSRKASTSTALAPRSGTRLRELLALVPEHRLVVRNAGALSSTELVRPARLPAVSTRRTFAALADMQRGTFVKPVPLRLLDAPRVPEHRLVGETPAMNVTPRLRELIEPAHPQPGMMSSAFRSLLARDVSAEIGRARKGSATPALEALRKTLVTEGIVELTPEESKAVDLLEDAVKETEQVDEVANMATEIAPARDAFFLAIQRSLASALEQRSRGEAARETISTALVMTTPSTSSSMSVIRAPKKHRQGASVIPSVAAIPLPYWDVQNSRKRRAAGHGDEDENKQLRETRGFLAVLDVIQEGDEEEEEDDILVRIPGLSEEDKAWLEAPLAPVEEEEPAPPESSQAVAAALDALVDTTPSARARDAAAHRVEEKEEDEEKAEDEEKVDAEDGAKKLSKGQKKKLRKQRQAAKAASAEAVERILVVQARPADQVELIEDAPQAATVGQESSEDQAFAAAVSQRVATALADAVRIRATSQIVVRERKPTTDEEIFLCWNELLQSMVESVQVRRDASPSVLIQKTIVKLQRHATLTPIKKKLIEQEMTEEIISFLELVRNEFAKHVKAASEGHENAKAKLQCFRDLITEDGDLQRFYNSCVQLLEHWEEMMFKRLTEQVSYIVGQWGALNSEDEGDEPNGVVKMLHDKTAESVVAGDVKMRGIVVKLVHKYQGQDIGDVEDEEEESGMDMPEMMLIDVGDPAPPAALIEEETKEGPPVSLKKAYTELQKARKACIEQMDKNYGKLQANIRKNLKKESESVLPRPSQRAMFQKMWDDNEKEHRIKIKNCRTPQVARAEVRVKKSRENLREVRKRQTEDRMVVYMPPPEDGTLAERVVHAFYPEARLLEIEDGSIDDDDVEAWEDLGEISSERKSPPLVLMERSREIIRCWNEILAAHIKAAETIVVKPYDMIKWAFNTFRMNMNFDFSDAQKEIGVEHVAKATQEFLDAVDAAMQRTILAAISGHDARASEAVKCMRDQIAGDDGQKFWMACRELTLLWMREYFTLNVGVITDMLGAYQEMRLNQGDMDDKQKIFAKFEEASMHMMEDYERRMKAGFLELVERYMSGTQDADVMKKKKTPASHKMEFREVQGDEDEEDEEVEDVEGTADIVPEIQEPEDHEDRLPSMRHAYKEALKDRAECIKRARYMHMQERKKRLAAIDAAFKAQEGNARSGQRGQTRDVLLALKEEEKKAITECFTNGVKEKEKILQEVMTKRKFVEIRAFERKQGSLASALKGLNSAIEQRFAFLGGVIEEVVPVYRKVLDPKIDFGWTEKGFENARFLLRQKIAHLTQIAKIDAVDAGEEKRGERCEDLRQPVLRLIRDFRVISWQLRDFVTKIVTRLNVKYMTMLGDMEQLTLGVVQAARKDPTRANEQVWAEHDWMMKQKIKEMDVDVDDFIKDLVRDFLGLTKKAYTAYGLDSIFSLPFTREYGILRSREDRAALDAVYACIQRMMVRPYLTSFLARRSVLFGRRDDPTWPSEFQKAKGKLQRVTTLHAQWMVAKGEPSALEMNEHLKLEEGDLAYFVNEVSAKWKAMEDGVVEALGKVKGSAVKGGNTYPKMVMDEQTAMFRPIRTIAAHNLNVDLIRLVFAAMHEGEEYDGGEAPVGSFVALTKDEEQEENDAITKERRERHLDTIEMEAVEEMKAMKAGRRAPPPSQAEEEEAFDDPMEVEEEEEDEEEAGPVEEDEGEEGFVSADDEDAGEEEEEEKSDVSEEDATVSEEEMMKIRRAYCAGIVNELETLVEGRIKHVDRSLIHLGYRSGFGGFVVGLMQARNERIEELGIAWENIKGMCGRIRTLVRITTDDGFRNFEDIEPRIETKMEELRAAGTEELIQVISDTAQLRHASEITKAMVPLEQAQEEYKRAAARCVLAYGHASGIDLPPTDGTVFKAQLAVYNEIENWDKLKDGDKARDERVQLFKKATDGLLRSVKLGCDMALLELKEGLEMALYEARASPDGPQKHAFLSMCGDIAAEQLMMRQLADPTSALPTPVFDDGLHMIPRAKKAAAAPKKQLEETKAKEKDEKEKRSRVSKRNEVVRQFQSKIDRVRDATPTMNLTREGSVNSQQFKELCERTIRLIEEAEETVTKDVAEDVFEAKLQGLGAHCRAFEEFNEKAVQVQTKAREEREMAAAQKEAQMKKEADNQRAVADARLIADVHKHLMAFEAVQAEVFRSTATSVEFTTECTTTVVGLYNMVTDAHTRLLKITENAKKIVPGAGRDKFVANELVEVNKVLEEWKKKYVEYRFVFATARGYQVTASETQLLEGLPLKMKARLRAHIATIVNTLDREARNAKSWDSINSSEVERWWGMREAWGAELVQAANGCAALGRMMANLDAKIKQGGRFTQGSTTARIALLNSNHAGASKTLPWKSVIRDLTHEYLATAESMDIVRVVQAFVVECMKELNLNIEKGAEAKAAQVTTKAQMDLARAQLLKNIKHMAKEGMKYSRDKHRNFAETKFVHKWSPLGQMFSWNRIEADLTTILNRDVLTLADAENMQKFVDACVDEIEDDL